MVFPCQVPHPDVNKMAKSGCIRSHLHCRSRVSPALAIRIYPVLKRDYTSTALAWSLRESALDDEPGELADIIRSLSMRRSFNITDAAFKVYSTAPLPMSECIKVRKFISAEDHHSLPTNLVSALRYLYFLTARVHASIDSIAGVFFQMFRPRNTLRALRLPWTRIPSTWRQWNLYCETYRSNPKSTISLPHIRLSIPNFNGVRAIPHSPWDGADNKVEVTLSANLRHSILRSSSADEHLASAFTEVNSDGFIQKIVDDIICAIASVTSGYTNTDPEEIISKTRKAVTSYLESSGLHSLLHFETVEVILMNSARQRYASNTFLNPDGSERHENKADQDGRPTTIRISGGEVVDDVPL